MDQFERCIAKLDEINTKITELRRYDRRMVLITMVLWLIGLPSVIFGSIIYAAWH